MAPQPLIKGLFILGLILLPAIGQAFDCKDVKVENKSAKQSEETTLCFLNDNSYFISESCISLKCNFMEKLKVKNLSVSEQERPGKATCQAFEGKVEEVLILPNQTKVARCVFIKDKASISLNLLESWDGKIFKGPSKPLKM